MGTADPFGPGGSKVVFFGSSLCVECQKCGAFSSTGSGHKFCIHITCPIATREFKRRKRKRTSTLEKVYMPRMQAKHEGEGEGPASASAPGIEPPLLHEGLSASSPASVAHASEGRVAGPAPHAP
jgi:hypothetical protein